MKIVHVQIAMLYHTIETFLLKRHIHAAQSCLKLL